MKIAKAFPVGVLVTSSLASGVVSKIPTLPWEMMRLVVGVMVMSPEVLLIVEEAPPIWSLEVGVVTPIPTLPALVMTKRFVPEAEAAKISWASV